MDNIRRMTVPRVTTAGFEPASTGLKGRELKPLVEVAVATISYPIGYVKWFVGEEGIGPSPRAPKARALPLRYTPSCPICCSG